MFQKATIKIYLFYLISVGFILLNLYFIVIRDQMVINVLPVLLAVLLVAIYSFDLVIYMVAFFAPLSVTLSTILPGFDFDMFLPTEPLLVGLLTVFLLRVIHDRGFDKTILAHPVSLAIYANLIWIFLTALTSTMPIVSFKFLLARIWFVVGLFFLTTKLFENGKNIEKYVWLYSISLVVVIFYTLNRHFGYGIWNKQVANFVCNPFYKDHTSYGAALAMYLPFMIMFSFGGFVSAKTKVVSIIMSAILLIGFILSYTRAAWLSMAVAIGIFVIIKLKIRFKPVFILTITLLVLFFSFQDQIFMSLEKNSKQSSADLMTHISSMSNISSDASNLERLNRWDCAIKMFREKPLFGYGPGTYMFQYAPFQMNANRTIISTNSADGGNAHSEYLGPLSESGILGLLTFLIIIITVSYTAIHTYSRLSDKRLKSIVLAAFIGLVTYYVHGFLNNFLDTDKLSVPFWGFTAMIVAIDILSRKQLKAQKIRTDASPD